MSREREEDRLEFVDRLPRSIEPERDLWPEIAAELRTRRARPSRFPTLRLSAPLLAAAALAVVVVSSTVTAVLLRRDATTVLDRPRPSSAVLTIEAQYAGAVEQLTAGLEARRASLDPHAVAVVEENLRIIDEAIREARVALGDDPENPDLGRMLQSAYANKLDLLKRATRLEEVET
jgi:hypothetical protein